MKTNNYLIFVLALVVGCASQSTSARQVVDSPASTATAAGARILKTGRFMALESKEIVKGSCWDYINEVYNRSGYGQHKRKTVFRTKKDSGPYAKAAQIQPGDWLYHINHSYRGVPHSGIFVRWVDRSKMIGETLSYGGEQRQKPGRYRNYDLSHVYTIIRPK